MDEQLYDQFGNYIGPQILSDSQSEQAQQSAKQENIRQGVQVVQSSNQHRIILHEDKKYYQSHEEMYPEAEIMIEQEDRQTLETPIVPKKQEKTFEHYEGLQTYYSTSYLTGLLKNPAVIRNVCVAGHLHHGKTLLIDMLIQQAHLRKAGWNLQKNYRWMDSRFDQQDRNLTIKALPISLLLPDFNQKHYALNIVDTPGHPNFIGQLVAGLRICDGVILVVDAVQGVMLMTDKIIKHCIREKLQIIIVINKIDRLIIEMRIPAEDAYLKLKHTLQELNSIAKKYSAQFGTENTYTFSPTLNNVVFASAEYGFMFSLQSMALKYQQRFRAVDPQAFKKILWGDYYFEAQTKKFVKKAASPFSKRTFVEFVLEPIYKIFSHTVGKDRDSLEFFLAKNLDVFLTPEQYKKNIKTMMKIILNRYFKTTASLVCSVVQKLPSPTDRVKQLVDLHYRGQPSSFRQKISKGKSDGPLLINTVKMYHQSDFKSFDVLGRVISGTLKKGEQIKIMGQGYEPGDQEDLFVKEVTNIYLLQGRYKLQLEEAVAGNYVLISGIDQAISKTSTIVHANNADQTVDIMNSLKFWTEPTIKVAIEPLVPSQLPKMIQAIRRVNKSYLLLRTKVQESGEHVLIGTGQLHLDAILNDIRNIYSDIQVRISDPCVTFCETVTETSGIPCYADTPNKKNRVNFFQYVQFTALAGPLNKEIADHVEKELIDIKNKAQLKGFLQTKFNWDILASNNIWSFGPQNTGSNVLINDTLVQSVDQNLVNQVKMSVVQGFIWSTKEGPLCDQPMRNVKFRLMDAEISPNMGQHPLGQVVPTARRAFYSSFLTANPRMMQPVYYSQIQCTTSESVESVFTVLAKRRGAVTNEFPKPGTPHYVIRAYIPCIEALGFQTDLRVHTVGQAFCLTTFDHWQTLPGDPLDKRIVLRPLQVHEHHELARQFMIKTRRRKGLNEQVSIVKYFDDLGIKDILKNDAAFKDFL